MGSGIGSGNGSGVQVKVPWTVNSTTVVILIKLIVDPCDSAETSMNVLGSVDHELSSDILAHVIS